MAGELFKVVELAGKYLNYQIEVDIQVAVHKHVSETCNLSETIPEIRRQDFCLDQAVDGRTVRHRVVTQGRREMSGDIEGGLCCELKSVFDGPAPVDIDAEFL